MHPVFAYFLWQSAMMRACGLAPDSVERARPQRSGVPDLGQYLLTQCLMTDVTSARLPDRFLDLLSELHWPKAA